VKKIHFFYVAAGNKPRPQVPLSTLFSSVILHHYVKLLRKIKL